WHATFNRIIILKEMADVGFRDWLFYLDADAFVVDLSYDVRRLISSIAKPLIMAPGGASGQYWDVNAGVFLIDFGNEAARDLIAAWYDEFALTSDEALREATEWDAVPNDQALLHRILRKNKHLQAFLGVTDRHSLNYRAGTFVKQFLRANPVTWEERLEEIRKATAAVLLPGATTHNVVSPGLSKSSLQKQDSSKMNADANELALRVKQFTWFHSIDLGNGIVTPGAKPPTTHARETAAFFNPIRMKDATVIDIGAWNGYYS